MFWLVNSGRLGLANELRCQMTRLKKVEQFSEKFGILLHGS
ncbi:conserved protein of unknown function [Lactiplantibacillus plantarum]|nr:Hypothetical protein zj316_0414 [Lactiplantibacillus plantarum ZJ316]AHN67877.1 hypothetical protein I526_0192 [Lactiplantibacillus plantarum DOMLa]ALC07394.1 hypothetical protein JM48_0179 [Lactiplantibacillus plantarum]EFK30576.1 hypothetical protein HMPREF0531_10281 [Lactiplantibacillus plantarum subsp. plantarum ATCC 14917 = JCM 1149 = CGMCC 1.2437]ERO40135.1 hypothetical protein LPLWJ_27530 [Lactiplantibacillus plantarum WJL]